MRFILLVVNIFFFPFFAIGQTMISGSVKNKKGEPLAANVMVQSKGSVAIAGYTTTNTEGNYSLSYKGIADSITLSITGMNVGKHSKTVANRNGQVDFVIDEKPLELKEVSITAPKIRRMDDTINYSVDAFKDQNDRVIGDVLKKLPGIEVSPSGAISYNGKGINKFYVENMDLLQGRYGIATNNIAAKDVASVQVLENHQPVKALRDRVLSDDAAVNLKLKDSAKGTLAATGMAGFGYQPLMWNAELVSMYFAKKMQNMSTFKGNNSGKDIVSEFLTHYDYERVNISSDSPLYVQSPGTPPIPQKRYLYNNSHAITTNQLIKLNEDMEFTASALYYNDYIKKEGYSFYEQYLPGDSILNIEEFISMRSSINNLEFALRFNSNAKNYYLNNAINLKGSWYNDNGSGITRSNTGSLDETISQRLDKPFFAVDNTFDMIKNLKNNSYKVYFSTGYGQRPHTLTVTPANYLESYHASSLSQDVLIRDFASVLRLSYGLKLGYFNLDYSAWGQADIRNMDTELHVANGNQPITPVDSLKNDLWYNDYQAGINQSYTYNNEKLKIGLYLPLIYKLITTDDRIPKTFSSNGKLIFNPSVSVRYNLTHEFALSTGANFNKSFGNINSSYSGIIMHSYRSLLRNTIDRLFETRSAGINASISYRNAFEALFISTGANYNYSWQDLLYGYDYRGIMSVKNTVDQPAKTERYGFRFSGSKGLDFWSATVRLSGGCSLSKGKQLIQGEIFNYRSQSYNAGTGINFNPIRLMGINYSFSWNQNRSYIVEQTEHFPSIRGIAQNAQVNLFPIQSLTINFNVEHQYNSAVSSPHTAFADAGIKFKRKQLDLELEINNIFNTKQYVSAYYSDVSAYFYSYELRPLSVLVIVRFKLK